MSSVCISNCVNDTRDPRVPVRATYVNLYKWPESDAEFVRSVANRNSNKLSSCSSSLSTHQLIHGQPRVVDSISCRQIYLRSYTFSREEDNLNDKTSTMCFGKQIKDKDKKEKSKSNSSGRKRKCLVLRKISSSAFFRIFYRLLSCSASVDVVDPKN